MTGMSCSFDCTVVTHPKKGTTGSGKNSLSFMGEHAEFTGENRQCWVNVHGPAVSDPANPVVGDRIHVEGVVVPIPMNQQRPDAPSLSINANQVKVQEQIKKH